MYFNARYLPAILATVVVFSGRGSAKDTFKLKNDKVAAWEENLNAGERVPISSKDPALILYLTDGTLEIKANGGARTILQTKTGQAKFEPAGIEELRNAGSSPLHALRVDFGGKGSVEHWGRTGLPSHYKVLLENDLVRVYDIFIPANSNEPQHTHKSRIVVCLSGAELTHLFPDGKTEVSTLNTGEIVWRKGSTHIGQNHSGNNFHAVAIEPK